MSSGVGLFVEVVLGLVRSARVQPGPSPVREAVAEALRPDPGLELVSPRGELHTGLIVVHDNTPVVTLTAKRGPPPRSGGPVPLPPWPDQDDPLYP